MTDFDYDILFAVNYYAPYTSGLTNVVRDLAEGFAARGQRVCVVATQHDPSLPIDDQRNGVTIHRTPLLLRIGKGPVSPSFIPAVAARAKVSRVLNIHSPMLEAGPISHAASAPTVVTYHCDVSLPPTSLGRVQNRAMDLTTRWSCHNADAIVVSSLDYAAHSRLASVFAKRKLDAIPPTFRERGQGEPRFRRSSGFHVGFLGRIVEEKGITYLVRAFRALMDPEARLLIAGDFDNVAGGSVIDEVRSEIANDSRIELLGFLPDDAIGDFYASIDTFVLPSVNPFEAYGIVQVEAMLAGVPVIASDMPGVRQPILSTGMGLLVSPGSVEDLLAALSLMRGDRQPFLASAPVARQLYSVDRILDAYGAIYGRVAAR